ncbi:helix-turn-helix transcriptional regulator [Streptomyces sp. NPDC021622]|uniref:helix-turn-helix transcriptional regulator n=1 Tax=Streptomyces sp. NPDC021622 TaxID=3155013 RepID=UPI0033E32B4A
MDNSERPAIADLRSGFASLSSLLRAWRAEAGMKNGRRKPLPQKEVAARMGVSERWYRSLETGTQMSLSHETLTSLADALELGPHERAALFWNALSEIVDKGGQEHAEIKMDRLKEFVSAQSRFPAYLIDHSWNVIGYNDKMAEWFPWVRTKGANLMRWVLESPESREQIVDWPAHATLYLAQLRFALVGYPDDPILNDLLTSALRSPECRDLWDSGPRIIAFRQGGEFRLSLPAISASELIVTSQVLLPAYCSRVRFVTLLPS